MFYIISSSVNILCEIFVDLLKITLNFVDVLLISKYLYATNDCFSFRMLMPKKNRVAIYEYLFKEGVLVAKKDYHAPKHPELETIPNLQVIKALQSLKSKGYVKEQFAWRHYYW